MSYSSPIHISTTKHNNVHTICYEMNVTIWFLKMIGTTLVTESHKEITYPSISVCSRTRADEYRNRSDLSLFHRTVNLSRTVSFIRMFYKRDTGHMQKMDIRPDNQDMDNMEELLYGHFALQTYAKAEERNTNVK